MRRGLRPLAVLALLGVALAPAAADSPRAVADAPLRFVSGWFPTWSSTSAAALGADALHPLLVRDGSPFAFDARRQGDSVVLVHPYSQSNLDRVVTALRSTGQPVLPSITDGLTTSATKGAMAALLADPVTRTQHVADIVALVTTNGFDGIDLDYEGFAFIDPRSSWGSLTDPTIGTRAAWAAFVIELSAALRAVDKMLAVTVPPLWNNGASGYWVYSLPEIVPHVDRLRLMVYDWSVSTAGPIAPMSWVDSVIATMHTIVPPERRGIVQLGVPAYGRSWATVVSGTCPQSADLATRSVLTRNAAALAATNGATPTRHSSGELTFSWTTSFSGPTTTVPGSFVPPPDPAQVLRTGTDSTTRPAVRLRYQTCTVRRTVYVPDATAIAARAERALDAGFGGIALWAFGYEDDAVWAALRDIGNRYAGTVFAAAAPTTTSTTSTTPSTTPSTTTPSTISSPATTATTTSPSAPPSSGPATTTTTIAPATTTAEPSSSIDETSGILPG